MPELLKTVIPPIVATAAVVAVVTRVFPLQGKGSGKSTLHWHIRGNKAVQHSHPGGRVTHMHRGLPGYGLTRKSIKR